MSILSVEEMRPIWETWDIIYTGDRSLESSISRSLKEISLNQTAQRSKSLTILVHDGDDEAPLVENLKQLEENCSRPVATLIQNTSFNVGANSYFRYLDNVGSVEFSATKVELENLKVGSFFAPELEDVSFNRVKFDEKTRAVMPKLKKLRIEQPENLGNLELLKYPEFSKILFCDFPLMIKNIVNPNCFENVKTLQMDFCLGTERIEDVEFKNLETWLILGELPVGIHNVKAPNLKNLEVRALGHPLKIENSVFKALEVLTFSGTGLLPCPGNVAPNLERLEINLTNNRQTMLSDIGEDYENLLDNIKDLKISGSLFFLSRLNLEKLNSLHAYDFDFDDEIPGFVMPNLTSIHLSRVIVFSELTFKAPNLEIFSAYDTTFICDIFYQVPSLFPKLRIMRVAGMFITNPIPMDSVDDEEAEEIVGPSGCLSWKFENHEMPELQHLTLKFDKRTVERDPYGFPHQLEISNCKFPKLNTLSIYETCDPGLKIKKLDIDAPNLEYIGIQGTGYGMLDLSGFNKLKVIIMSYVGRIMPPKIIDRLEFIQMRACRFNINEFGTLRNDTIISVNERLGRVENLRKFLKYGKSSCGKLVSHKVSVSVFEVFFFDVFSYNQIPPYVDENDELLAFIRILAEEDD